jgi:hypothetical protein
MLSVSVQIFLAVFASTLEGSTARDSMLPVSWDSISLAHVYFVHTANKCDDECESQTFSSNVLIRDSMSLLNIYTD